MSTLECGCWTGPWWGINPPPQCYEHQYGSSSNRITVTRTVKRYVPEPAPTVATPPPDELIDTVHAGILREAATAIESGNPAAHDAWQLVLQHIEPLRAAIE